MTHTTNAAKLTRTLTLTAAGALIALSGCSRSDEAQAAVKEAGRSFASISAGDPNAARSHSEKTYRETEQLAQQHAGSEDGYAEAAAISVALSKLGQASLASQDASSAETRSLQKARVIRGMINEWLTMSAIAQAAGKFDPSAEIREIDGIVKLRQQDIAQYQRQRELINAEITELEAKIADLRDKSRSERNEAGALELQMPRLNAAEAAKLAERVREHTLRADQFELEAIRVEGVVGQLKPGAREINLNVEKARSQIELLQKAVEELRERETSSRSDAQQAQQNADAAAKRIADAVSDYDQFRDSEVASANEKAISTTRSAISALRDASNATKKVAQMTKSSAQQTLAECFSRQAGGFAEAALLYQSLKEAGLSGNWDSKIQAATDAQEEAKTSAQQAYQDAASSLRSARATGAEAQKVEATAQRLDILGGVEPEPEYDDQDAWEDESAGEQYDDQGAEEETPEEDE